MWHRSHCTGQDGPTRRRTSWAKRRPSLSMTLQGGAAAFVIFCSRRATRGGAADCAAQPRGWSRHASKTTPLSAEAAFGCASSPAKASKPRRCAPPAGAQKHQPCGATTREATLWRRSGPVWCRATPELAGAGCARHAAHPYYFMPLFETTSQTSVELATECASECSNKVQCSPQGQANATTLSTHRAEKHAARLARGAHAARLARGARRAKGARRGPPLARRACATCATAPRWPRALRPKRGLTTRANA